MHNDRSTLLVLSSVQTANLRHLSLRPMQRLRELQSKISSISWLTQSCHPFSISCMLSRSALAASSFCVFYSLTLTCLFIQKNKNWLSTCWMLHTCRSSCQLAGGQYLKMHHKSQLHFQEHGLNILNLTHVYIQYNSGPKDPTRWFNIYMQFFFLWWHTSYWNRKFRQDGSTCLYFNN